LPYRDAGDELHHFEAMCKPSVPTVVFVDYALGLREFREGAIAEVRSERGVRLKRAPGLGNMCTLGISKPPDFM
jgi:hypothetical protein